MSESFIGRDFTEGNEGNEENVEGSGLHGRILAQSPAVSRKPLPLLPPREETGVWTFFGLSRRDCETKPRVARNELPWVGCGQRHNPIGVAAEPKEIYAAIAVSRLHSSCLFNQTPPSLSSRPTRSEEH